MKFSFGLLPRVILAIGLGVGCGFFFPEWATRIALTFNDIFGQFLSFIIPLLILGLVAPGIADLGRNAGWLLAVTAALAYGFTLFSGFGTYLVGRAVFPALLEGSSAVQPGDAGAALGSSSRSRCRRCSASCRRWCWRSCSDWAWPTPTASG